MNGPEKNGYRYHTVTLKVRVWSLNPAVARMKVLALFAASLWPKGSVSIESIKRGWS